MVSTAVLLIILACLLPLPPLSEEVLDDVLDSELHCPDGG